MGGKKRPAVEDELTKVTRERDEAIEEIEQLIRDREQVTRERDEINEMVQSRDDEIAELKEMSDAYAEDLVIKEGVICCLKVFHTPVWVKGSRHGCKLCKGLTVGEVKGKDLI